MRPDKGFETASRNGPIARNRDLLGESRGLVKCASMAISETWTYRNSDLSGRAIWEPKDKHLESAQAKGTYVLDKPRQMSGLVSFG